VQQNHLATNRSLPKAISNAVLPCVLTTKSILSKDRP